MYFIKIFDIDFKISGIFYIFSQLIFEVQVEIMFPFDLDCFGAIFKTVDYQRK